MVKVAISGVMCSGKTTLAKHVIGYVRENFHGEMLKMSFADGIYEIAHDLFNMTVKDRKLLQQIGHAMRHIDPYVWIDDTIGRCKKHDHVIIDDIRFRNELMSVKRAGFVTIRLKIDEETQLERRYLKSYTISYASQSKQ